MIKTEQLIHSQSKPVVAVSTALLIVIIFVISVVSINKYDINSALGHLGFPLFLMIALRIPFKRVKVLLAALPFALIVGAANLFLDHSSMHWGTMVVSGGFLSFLVIACKSITAIWGLLIVTSIFPFYSICKALREFHIPSIFVTQLLLLYRYIHLIVDEAKVVSKARDMRSFEKKGMGVKPTAQLIGALLLRTIDRGDRIYKAMSARGFTTSFAVTTPIRFTKRDYITTGIVAVFLIALHIFI